MTARRLRRLAAQLGGALVVLAIYALMLGTAAVLGVGATAACAIAGAYGGAAVVTVLGGVP